jgi:hypothetical protein
MPEVIYPTAMYTVIVELYANSFLAGLNMRPHLQASYPVVNGGSTAANNSFALSSVQHTPISNVDILKKTASQADSNVGVGDVKTRWNSAAVV